MNNAVIRKLLWLWLFIIIFSIFISRSISIINVVISSIILSKLIRISFKAHKQIVLRWKNLLVFVAIAKQFYSSFVRECNNTADKVSRMTKKRNSTKIKDLNLTFDRFYEEHYNLEQIQEFQDVNWKKNHIQKKLEERLKTQMRMFYKERKKNNT